MYSRVPQKVSNVINQITKILLSQIDDDTMCNAHEFAAEPNQFCLENIDVSNFLNLHSLGNHEDFCLAYVFTYRDFTGGTLGKQQL